MKIFSFLIVVAFFAVGCDDGKDGSMGVEGLTGPSGIAELTADTCNDPLTILTTIDEEGEDVRLVCLTAEEIAVIDAEAAVEAAEQAAIDEQAALDAEAAAQATP